MKAGKLAANPQVNWRIIPIALTTPESAGRLRIVGNATTDALPKLHKPGYTPIKTKQFRGFPSLRFSKGEIPRAPTALDFSPTAAIRLQHFSSQMSGVHHHRHRTAPPTTMEIDLCVRAEVCPFPRGRRPRSCQAHGFESFPQPNPMIPIDQGGGSKHALIPKR